MSAESEFDFIARWLAPLSHGAPGAAGLADDGALIDLDAGETLAVTTDTLIEGRHFPVSADPKLAAQKALRANLSDLAAMGATPSAYCLNVVWPQDGAGARVEPFISGLREDQEQYGICLIGGDTTRGSGPWVISITAFGRRPVGLNLRRSGARAGDVLIATGTIGDAALGLRALNGEPLGALEDESSYLVGRSLKPEPRLDAVQAMRRHAHAAIDVSDGLLADARHLAVQSGLRLALNLESIPLSAAARTWLESQPQQCQAFLALACGGDDYELLISTARGDALVAELAAVGVPAVEVGRFEPGSPGVQVRFQGEQVTPGVWGFTHF